MSIGILTPGLAYEAVQTLKPQIEQFLQQHAKRQHLAIVVTAVEEISPRSPDKSFEEDCLVVDSIGDPNDWEHDYKSIALSKAEKSVRTGMATAKLGPQYLLDADTVFWGSEVLDGIVVACSGVEPYYDEMVSMWIAATIRAFCKKAFAELPDGTEFIE